MSEVAISVHAGERPAFTTTDPLTVAKLRAGLGAEASHLVPAHHLARLLRGAGRGLWAGPLELEEEAHLVRVVFSGH